MYKHIVNDYIARACPLFPYVYHHNIFSDDEVSHICDLFSKKEKESGKVAKETSELTDVRVSNIAWSKYTENEFFWIFQRLNNVIDNLNNHHYNYHLNGYDHIQYGEYDSEKKGHYTWHMDLIMDSEKLPDAGMNRKLSCSILLNEPEVDFEGGDFEINTFQESNSIRIPKENFTKGSIIAFPSWLIHRVKPVTRGVRKSLVVWVLGPTFR